MGRLCLTVMLMALGHLMFLSVAEARARKGSRGAAQALSRSSPPTSSSVVKPLIPAAVLGSYCLKPEVSEGKGNSQLEGAKMESPMVIGSLTKLFTSLWAADVLASDHRFQTQIEIFYESPTEARLRIINGGDPFFDPRSLKLILYNLQNLGIQRVKEIRLSSGLSFLPFIKKWAASSALPEERDFRSDLRDFFHRYQQRNAGTRQIYAPLDQQLGVLNIEVENIIFSDQTFPNVGRKLILYSQPIARILKEMNRFSHNFVAQSLFDHLGGTKGLQKYLERKYGASSRTLRILNGSGLPEFLDGKKVYNLASCRWLTKVLEELDGVMDAKFAAGLELVLPVAGEEIDGEDPSTVSRFYRNSETQGVLVGKTGTVNPAVALAGQVSTAEGHIYFGIVFQVNRRGGIAQGRTMIRSRVNEILVRQQRGDSYPRRMDPYFPVSEAQWQ